MAPLSFTVLGPARIPVNLGLLLLLLLPLPLSPPVASRTRTKTPATPTISAKARGPHVLTQARVPLLPVCISSCSDDTDMDLLLECGMGLLVLPPVSGGGAGCMGAFL